MTVSRMASELGMPKDIRELMVAELGAVYGGTATMAGGEIIDWYKKNYATA